MDTAAYWKLQLLEQSLGVMQLASTRLIISYLQQNDSDYCAARGNH